MKKSLLFITSLILLSACGVTKFTYKYTTYKQMQKETKDTTLQIQIPSIEIDRKTVQLQQKGGIVVSCEVVPHSVEFNHSTGRDIFYSDPSSPGFDIFEVRNTPVAEIYPNNLQFKIKVRNNQDRLLKLWEVPIILNVNNIQTNLTGTQLEEWNGAKIAKGFEHEFTIHGPKLSGFKNLNSIYIAAHDIPVLYDKAGNITEKQNFEWIYNVKMETVSKTGKITYAYEKSPVHKERCHSCSGRGYFINKYKCNTCNGNGSYKNKKGETVKCGYCGGDGIVEVKENCQNCSGHGEISYPKSTLPPIESQIAGTGWYVGIKTIPSPAVVKVYSAETNEYKFLQHNQNKGFWYATHSSDKPILIEYNGKTVKVVPYDNEGNEIDDIKVDFTSGSTPAVLAGKKIE